MSLLSLDTYISAWIISMKTCTQANCNVATQCIITESFYVFFPWICIITQNKYKSCLVGDTLCFALEAPFNLMLSHLIRIKLNMMIEFFIGHLIISTLRNICKLSANIYITRTLKLRQEDTYINPTIITTSGIARLDKLAGHNLAY